MHDESKRRAADARHAVVIAGAGPTGLMLAAELALARVDVVLVERRGNQKLEGARAGGFHARTLELLDQRGIVERFLVQGQKAQIAGFARAPLDISDFPTRHNYGLALWQERIEVTLAEWVSELGVPVLRSREVTDFSQDEAGVDVRLSDGSVLGAKYLVGCDGGRSLVRKKAGIEFAGWDPSVSYLIAEVEFAHEPAWGLRHGEKGVYAIAKHEDGKHARVVLSERELRTGDAPAIDELRGALDAVYGSDFGLLRATYVSRFTDMARQAVAYRNRRVLLAGDSAHVHSPVGGQGLNTGLHDAVNLGWKLAQVVSGSAPDDLLDTYQVERHPIAARVLRLTLAQTALHRGDAQSAAARDIVSDLLGIDAARKRYAGIMSGLDVRYELGEGHPLLGRRMPDLDLATADGEVRVFTLLHAARPVLLDFGAGASLDVTAWAERVRLVRARYEGAWDLPVIGCVPAPQAVLIRPDGYVAWVGVGTDAGLTDAIARWFGAPTRASLA